MNQMTRKTNTEAEKSMNQLLNEIRSRLNKKNDESADIRKKLLVCMGIEAYLMLRGRLKRKNYTAGNIIVGGKKIVFASMSREPLILTAGLDTFIYTRLFKISKCLKNYTSPESFFVKVNDIEATALYMINKYAGDVLKHKIGAGGPRFPISIKRRRGEISDLDPLEIAIERCIEKQLHKLNNQHFERDLMQYLNRDDLEVVYGDGIESNAILIQPREKPCPIMSITILNSEEMYIVHAGES